MPNTIAIAGGGASGVLVADAILRSDPTATIRIFETSALGRGIAYSTTCPVHLLNVPASNMTARADAPGDFLRWLERRYPATYAPTSFVPRAIYGEYLDSIAGSFGARVTQIRSHVLDAYECDGRVTILTADATYEADALVLATGHSSVHRGGYRIDSDRFIDSPWLPGACIPHDPDEPVAIVGSGLTAIDAVLALRYHGHDGPITLVSNRGLLPHEHRFGTNRNDWRQRFDALRPVTNQRWQAMSLVEQRRFLRHYAPWWNVHRHRMAPHVARQIAELIASGTLNVIAGRIQSIDPTASGLSFVIRERGSQRTIALRAARAIDCTGPSQDLRKTANPLLKALLQRKTIQPHPVAVGMVVADDGALVGARGERSRCIFTVGPLRYGTLFETTAIPEIRVQAQELARTVLRLHDGSYAGGDAVVASDGIREVVR